jgi:hypothetical protein
VGLPASELFTYGGVWIVGSAFACWCGAFYTEEGATLTERKRATIGPAIALALSVSLFIWERQSAIDTACSGIREAAESYASDGNDVPNRLFAAVPGLRKASDICNAAW